MKKLVFDIMIGNRFVATERMDIDIDMIESYDGDVPVINIEILKERILKKRPTLKYENFRICF